MARPSFKPTDEHRRMVKSMAAVGIPQEQIAIKVGIRSPKTLRKHFPNELALGATEANYKVAQTLFKWRPPESARRRRFFGPRLGIGSGSVIRRSPRKSYRRHLSWPVSRRLLP